MKPEVQHYIRDLVHFVKQNKPQVCIESDIRENTLAVRLILMLTKSFQSRICSDLIIQIFFMQNSFENTNCDQQSWEQTGHHHDFTAPYRQIESHYSTQQNIQDSISHTMSYNNDILNSPHTISSQTSQHYDNDTYSDYTIAQSPQPSQIMTSFQASTSSPSPVTPRRSPRKHTQSNQDFRKVKLMFQLKIILNYQYS